MDVTFVCSGEDAFNMEVGYFDTVQDVKEKLQSHRGWPAAAISLIHNAGALEDVDVDGGTGSGIERHGVVEGSVIHVTLLDGQQHQHQPPQQNKRTTEKRKRRAGEAAPLLRVTVVSRCGEGRVEMAVAARAAVSVLRAELERARGAGAGAPFPLPRDGAYFFIHGQSVMDESRSFEWHGVATGDEVVVFDGSVTRNPA